MPEKDDWLSFIALIVILVVCLALSSLAVISFR